MASAEAFPCKQCYRLQLLGTFTCGLVAFFVCIALPSVIVTLPFVCNVLLFVCSVLPLVCSVLPFVPYQMRLASDTICCTVHHTPAGRKHSNIIVAQLRVAGTMPCRHSAVMFSHWSAPRTHSRYVQEVKSETHIWWLVQGFS